jgi:xanthine dehydrogenase small subunit
MRDHLLLNVNGRTHVVHGHDAFATLANWLRARGATGTKIVCEEGDCGACTVLVRRGDAFVPVNSCIQSMFQLDAASIVTVEGLGMNAVQEAMVVNHGAQCGYCTPGFVVAMTGLFETRDKVDETCARAGLVGNLCRCTGYEPIIKAACAVEGAAMQRMSERYPQRIEDSQPVLIEDNERTFFAPVSLDDALSFKRKFKPCTIVQGCTDVGVWINKRAYSAQAMLSLAKIPELHELREEQGSIVVGANVSLTELEDFTRDRIPELHRILNIFGSAQIKNAGTLVGNIANGSPIGDTLPYLFVSGATLEIASVDGKRIVDINDFYRGYKQFDLGPHELITKVRVPIVNDSLRLYKISRRRDLDISAFTAAIRLRRSNSHIDSATIAYGGVAPTVLRMHRTESFLAGKPLSIETFEAAGRIAREEVAPITDVRGSRDYRLQLAENILCKFYYDELLSG